MRITYNIFEVKHSDDIKEAQQRKERIRELIIHLDKIPKGSFQDFKNLEVLKIEGNLTEIGGYAFYGCTKLKDLGDLSSVITIKAFAFDACESIENLSLPNAMLIENNVFHNCKAIQSIDAPKVKINNYAFYGCPKIDPEKVDLRHDYSNENRNHVFETPIRDLISSLMYNKKKFMMYLINCWEFALRVESKNMLNEDQSRKSLVEDKDLSTALDIAKSHVGRHGKVGATCLWLSEFAAENIDDLIVREIQEEALDKIDDLIVGDKMDDVDSNGFLWVIPTTAYEAVVEGLSKIGTIKRVISVKELEFAKLARERESKHMYDLIPSANAKELRNVPQRIRTQLTSWQRRGVAFATERKGTCMIGDEVSRFEGFHTSHVTPSEQPTHFSSFYTSYIVPDGSREDNSSNCIHVCIQR